MRLPPGIIKLMAEKAAESLLATKAARVDDRAHLVHAVERGIEEELGVEEKLLAEADKLLQAHHGAVRAQGANVAELREKIVRKLAQERGLVLR